MAYLESTLNWASYANSDDKLGFLKSLLQTFGHEELNCAKGLLKRRREKVIKGSYRNQKSWKGPRLLTGLLPPVGHPVQAVGTPGEIYPEVVQEKDEQSPGNWYDEHKLEEFVAFDVEGVHRFKKFLDSHGNMHTPHDKEFPVGASIKEKEPTIVKAAYIGVVDYRGRVLQEDTIQHCSGTFKVDYWSKKKSGVTSTRQFVYGKPFPAVQEEFVRRFGEKFHITCGGENDYKFLELAVGDYKERRFDLQQFYQRPDPENPELMQPMSLRDMYWYHFKVDFQRGVHNATTDAKATMKVFIDGYCKLNPKDEFDFSGVPNLNSKERKGLFWCNMKKDFGSYCNCKECVNVVI